MAGVVGGNAHIWTTQWSTINESLATYPCGLVPLCQRESKARFNNDAVISNDDGLEQLEWWYMRDLQLLLPYMTRCSDL